MRKGKPLSKKELKKIAEKLRSGEMKIKVVSQDKLLKYMRIAEEFFTDILDMNIHKCLITDGSSLDEFPENLKIYKKKIKDKYGIKLPAGYGKHLILVNIFKKIDIIFYQAPRRPTL
jgi:hypothetical protein